MRPAATLNATDVDSAATFVAQSGVAGSNGYGTFSIDADGRLDLHAEHRHHDEFVGGTRPTPTASRWRRPTAPTQVITITINGTNDAAVITGTATASADGDQCGADARGGDRWRSSAPTWTARRPSWRRPTWPAQRLRHVLDRRDRCVDLHAERRPRRVRAAAHDLHRQLHGGDGRRHRAGHHRHHQRHQRRGGDHRHGDGAS